MHARATPPSTALETQDEVSVPAATKLVAQLAPESVDLPSITRQPCAVAQLLMPGEPYLDPARRLVVLMPDVDSDEAALASQIWTMAKARGLSVLYLTADRGFNTQYRARRRLAHLAALTRDDRVHVETCRADTADWITAIRAETRPGDLIVCHAEQKGGSRFRTRPLSQVLLKALGTPVCVLSGFYSPDQLASPSLVARTATWVVQLGIVAAFFWVQVFIARLPDTPVETFLLIVSVLVEFGLIWLSQRRMMGPL